MGMAQPVIRKIKDNPGALEELEKRIDTERNLRIKEIIANFPTIYIHNWKSTGDYEVYIGESNNIFLRTRQHYEKGDIDAYSWQRKLKKKSATLYVIGHEHFNKSMTLDIENRLMHYMLSVPEVRKVHNMRGNPQSRYFPVEEMEDIFSKVWKKLRDDNQELFPPQSKIQNLAIFKASPLHKLTKEQEEVRELVIEKVKKALRSRRGNQIIFIEGEAGTGKTVLNSSTFYEIYCQMEEENRKCIKCSLVVNHREQLKVYEQIFKKLGITDKYGKVVLKPTTFINQHSVKNPADVVFVDEAHLLWTQGKQSYLGSNQLEDIVDRARVTVVMFDENQILTTEQYWEAEVLNYYRSLAKNDHNYFELKHQLRMRAGGDIIAWIDSFTKERNLRSIPKGGMDYRICVFESVEKLDVEICTKAKYPETSLSRLIATYDWEYNADKRPTKKGQKYWEVRIGDWHKPWNRELKHKLKSGGKRVNSGLSWAEQKQTINEVGSTYTIQGFDLNYAGVILGPSVKYRGGRIVFDPAASCNAKAVRNRTLSDGTRKKFGEELIQHEVRVLMTRGVNGLYIYACDEELRKALISAAK